MLTVTVPKKEFQQLKTEVREMEERLEILSDKALMNQLLESEKDIKEGKVRSFDEVKKELGI